MPIRLEQRRDPRCVLHALAALAEELARKIPEDPRLASRIGLLYDQLEGVYHDVIATEAER
jgi:hypothetical protein